MGWDNPPVSWSDHERTLSGRTKSAKKAKPLVEDVLADNEFPGSKTRQPYVAPKVQRPTGPVVPYAELHCHSNFSFLDGASSPEKLAEQAAFLGLAGLALTDHDGFYGVVRFAEVARKLKVPTIFGAELSLGLPAPPTGEADPPAQHVVVLARNPVGYAALASAISTAQLAGEKGRPVYDLEALAAKGDGNLLVLTGCRKGTVPAALRAGGLPGARRELDRLVALFGQEHVAVELIDHDQPEDDERNDALFQLAADFHVPTVATNNVHYAEPQHHQLAAVLAAVRARRSLDEIDPWLPAAGTAYLRSGAEMAQRFASYPGAVAHSVQFAQECAFDLALVAPQLPPFNVPQGHDENSWLRELAHRGWRRRYAGSPEKEKAFTQLEKELGTIKELGYPGYFLIVHELVDFCERHNILCQGRGSAANSVVCYSLGITNAEPIFHELLFERFLSREREGPPDIDIDIESDQREKVIQFVYDKYGRHHTAQVANVISYRPKSAIRDAAKAFGFSPGQQDAWSKQIERDGKIHDVAVPKEVIDTANQLAKFPRHLGIHSGGMVICDRPVSEVCPVEWARMENRSVLQWDKDDCADVGLVKFDLLGLGMLSALRYMFEFIADHHGERYTLATIPPEDPHVYTMLQKADAVGVFQVESRAQLATLPRLKPSTFYDLVVEVALIRPGPIQGNSVHPYIRRANGLEEITYDHPKLEKSLKKTKGIPLFQEQLMQMVVDIAGFSQGEADLLRRAISAKRSDERMNVLRPRVYAGMAENGITGALADSLYQKIQAFANFGFPESHAISFAKLAYNSSWIKRYYPAAFCAALLKAQPMGFYSPHTLVEDARRHGVPVRGPDINASGVHATLEPGAAGEADKPVHKARPDQPPSQWGTGGPTVRIGLSSVRALTEKSAERIVAERGNDGPFGDMSDLVRRTELPTAALEALATAGAFDCFSVSRRAALWSAGAVTGERDNQLNIPTPGAQAPTLPGMSDAEIVTADMWATGLSTTNHPVAFVRKRLTELGAVPITQLAGIPTRTRLLVAGLVTHRQRPATAGGITFLNLEDETGMLNVVCSPGLWTRHRTIARTSNALLIRGRLESAEGVINLYAERLTALPMNVNTRSRDFR